MTRNRKSTGNASASNGPSRRSRRKAKSAAEEHSVVLPPITRAGGVPLPGRNAQQVFFREPLPNTVKRFMPNVDTFPTNFAAPLRYAIQVDGTTDAGTADVFAFSLNSLYDPYVTGVGTQPKFFTTLCGAAGGTAPYDTYTVVRAHVRVTMQNVSTTAIFGYVQVYSDTSGITPTSPLYEYLETPNLLRVPLLSANNDTGVRVVDFSVDVGKFLGLEDILDADYCRAQYDASPARQLYMDIGFRANNDTSTTNYSFTAEIVYEAVFCGLGNTSPALYQKPPSQSAPVERVEASPVPTSVPKIAPRVRELLLTKK